MIAVLERNLKLMIGEEEEAQMNYINNKKYYNEAVTRAIEQQLEVYMLQIASKHLRDAEKAVKVSKKRMDQSVHICNQYKLKITNLEIKIK